MSKIIITGATSFLGLHTVKELANSRNELYLFVRRESPGRSLIPVQPNIKVIWGTLDELERLTDTIKNADVLIHYAWDGSGYEGRANEEIQAKNIEYSMNALLIAERLGCSQFIFPGSQAEYGNCPDSVDETHICRPVSPYGRAKLEFSRQAETYLRNRRLNFIHLRIFSVYGFGDRESTLVNTCINQLNRFETVELGPCTQMWNFLYINDFTKMLRLIIEKKIPAGTYNVAGNDTRVLREFAEEIYRLSNKSGTLHFQNASANPEGSPNLMPVIDKILNAVGPIPFTDFADGITMIMKMKQMETQKQGRTVQ